MNALKLAILFHETYGRLAPSFGYETRDDAKKFDETSKNDRLIVVVCGKILSTLKASVYDKNSKCKICNAIR